MTVEDKIGRPLVPVPWEHLDEVRAFLEHLEIRDNAGIDDTQESRAKIVRTIVESCSPATQRMIRYMAEQLEQRPGEKFLGEELAPAADPEGPTNVSPYLKSVNSATKKLGIEWDRRLVWAEPRPDRLFHFWMSPEDAEIVRGFVR
jgi:hypothetical protein